MEKLTKLNIKKINHAVLTIFGATGDLNKRLLIPALYNLFLKGKIQDNVPIICVARKNYTKQQFLKAITPKTFIKNYNEKDFSKFSNLIHYLQLDFANEDYSSLVDYLSKVDKKHKCHGNRLFYLATPPSLFPTVSKNIKNSNLLKGKGWKRVVFEKPFGYDLKSARNLNKHISKLFKENQIYRIDHFLGKELVQNIIVSKFANSIFKNIWNNKHIDHVQIIADEKLGVGTRGRYYNEAGAIRDMIQNHVLQMMSLVAMSEPKSLKADDIRSKKAEVIRLIKPLSNQDVVIGQYNNYKKEKDVPKTSSTETFAAVKMFLNNKDWEGVPFYLRSGKKLKERYVEINFVFKDTSCEMFDTKNCPQNVFSIRIQPDEGIAIMFNSKIPSSLQLYPVAMEFCHSCEFGVNTPSAYERLLNDVLIGDQTLFTSWKEVEASWKIIDQIEKIASNKKLEIYNEGSKGPKCADDLIKKNGKWIFFKRKVKLQE